MEIPTPHVYGRNENHFIDLGIPPYIHFFFGCAIAVTLMWGTYFHMGSYKFNVIEMSAYIHGCLFSMGAHYSDFRLFFYAGGF